MRPLLRVQFKDLSPTKTKLPKNIRVKLILNRPSLVLCLLLNSKCIYLTPKLSGSDIVTYWLIKIWLRKWNFFLVARIFYMILDFKNGCKNEFKDNNEKSCSWFRNRVSRKIDFKVQWLRNSHTDSVGV